MGFHLFPSVRVFAFPFVGGFIAISGYLITDSMARSRGYGHFAWKRLLRVGPGFVASLLFGAFFGFSIVGTLHCWATFGLWDHPKVNGVFWSLSVEEVLYALLALMFAVGVYRRAPAFILAALYAAFFMLPHSQSAAVMRVLEIPPYFLAGSFLYVLRARTPWRWWLGVLGLVYPFLPLPAIGLCPLAVAYGLISLGLYSRPVLGWWTKRIGDPSYGVYVYHLPVVSVLGPAGIPVAIVVAVTSWHVVEKRALALKDWRPKGGALRPARALSLEAES